MVAEIVTFRVRHDGPLAQYTKARPHLQLAVWCNLNYDVYELTGAQPRDADELATALGHDAEIHRGDTGQTVILRCSNVAHNVVARQCYAARCLHVAPATHNDGWEYATMISFDEESTRDAFRRLKTAGHEIDLVSKRAAPGHPLLQQGGPIVGVLLERLTDRQAEAVLLAHRHGHYASPRETTAAAIATSLGLSRSTFEEHLRKAENALVNGIVPYLELELRTRRLKAGQ